VREASKSTETMAVGGFERWGLFFGGRRLTQLYLAGGSFRWPQTPRQLGLWNKRKGSGEGKMLSEKWRTRYAHTSILGPSSWGSNFNFAFQVDVPEFLAEPLSQCQSRSQCSFLSLPPMYVSSISGSQYKHNPLCGGGRAW
jgi:hypothetical protein